MLFSGLRSAEVLALTVADVDIARGWARVTGKGGRERRVPVDVQVAGWVQTYLLAERPESASSRLFVVGFFLMLAICVVLMIAIPVLVVLALVRMF